MRKKYNPQIRFLCYLIEWWHVIATEQMSVWSNMWLSIPNLNIHSHKSSGNIFMSTLTKFQGDQLKLGLQLTGFVVKQLGDINKNLKNCLISLQCTIGDGIY